jgi:hypothetical protein
MNYRYKYLKYKKKYLQLIGGSESFVDKTIDYSNGDVYKGNTINNIPHGYGTMTYENSSYEGYWKNGNKHGYGTMTYENGSYKGYWENDNKHGQGLMTYEYGDTYEGNYENDKRNGLGTFTYSNGNNYVGQWKDGNMHGQGILTYENGDVFEGNWDNDLKSGDGIMTYENGNQFIGTWNNDILNSGFLTLVDKTIIEYRDGKQINDKPDDLKSVLIINQKENDCWAHAISRNFVRTFQILSIIKFKLIQKFYDLFYTILTKYKTCKKGLHMRYGMFYLFNYLKENYNDKIFTIIYDDNECTQLYCRDRGVILNINQADKYEIIAKLKYFFDNNLLFIGSYHYLVNLEGNNKPTNSIKIMLNYKLQPAVIIYINKYLDTELVKQTINLPSIKEKINFDKKCMDSDVTSDSHLVNLRKWNRNYIEFKNSWGTDKSNEGNFSVIDLKYLLCINDEYKINNTIQFMSLMFDYKKFSSSLEKIFTYNLTFDMTLEIETLNNYKGGYNDYGLYHGKGKLTFNYKEYEGDFENGNMHGHGTMTYSDGSQYDGKFKDDSKNGHGIYTYSDGSQYDGNWENDKIHGHGTMTYPDSTYYDGYWENDKRHGHGTMTYSDSTYYDGNWENDKRYGHGTMTYSDGSQYDGNWVNHQQHGHGTMTYSDGNKYDGNWVYDKRHGRGTMTYPDGTQNDGDWKNDQYRS